MISDEQLIQQLRVGFAEQASGLRPGADLREALEAELRHSPRRRLPGVRRGLVSGVLAAAVVVAVVLVAVLDVHSSPTPHGGTPRSSPATAPVLKVGSSRLIKTTRDPLGGGSWGLREYRTSEHRDCLTVGRVHDGELGVLGQDGAYHNDGAFHPLSMRADAHCGQTNASEDVELGFGLTAVAASGAQGKITSCTVHGQAFTNGSLTFCAPRDLRAVYFGILGPDVSRITYSINNHNGSEHTGPQGSYLVVVPTTGMTCTPSGTGGPSGSGAGGNEGSCVFGPTIRIADGLQPGPVTSVTYRDGTTCALTSRSGSLVNRSCPTSG